MNRSALVVLDVVVRPAEERLAELEGIRSDGASEALRSARDAEDCSPHQAACRSFDDTERFLRACQRWKTGQKNDPPTFLSRRRNATLFATACSSADGKDMLEDDVAFKARNDWPYGGMLNICSLRAHVQYRPLFNLLVVSAVVSTHSTLVRHDNKAPENNVGKREHRTLDVAELTRDSAVRYRLGTKRSAGNEVIRTSNRECDRGALGAAARASMLASHLRL